MLGNNYAATKLPTYTVAGQQVQMSCYFGYKMLGVNPYSKNLDWAHKLAAYISNEENQKLRFEIRGQGPSNINASKDDEIMQSQAVQSDRLYLHRLNFQNCKGLAAITGTLLLNLESLWHQEVQAVKTSRVYWTAWLRGLKLLQ